MSPSSSFPAAILSYGAEAEVSVPESIRLRLSGLNSGTKTLASDLPIENPLIQGILHLLAERRGAQEGGRVGRPPRPPGPVLQRQGRPRGQAAHGADGCEGAEDRLWPPYGPYGEEEERVCQGPGASSLSR
jgi:hypothetical protein